MVTVAIAVLKMCLDVAVKSDTIRKNVYNDCFNHQNFV